MNSATDTAIASGIQIGGSRACWEAVSDRLAGIVIRQPLVCPSGGRVRHTDGKPVRLPGGAGDVGGLRPQTCRPRLCTRADPDPVIKVRSWRAKRPAYDCPGQNCTNRHRDVWSGKYGIAFDWPLEIWKASMTSSGPSCRHLPVLGTEGLPRRPSSEANGLKLRMQFCSRTRK
jgi:hypothetical protein